MSCGRTAGAIGPALAAAHDDPRAARRGDPDAARAWSRPRAPRSPSSAPTARRAAPGARRAAPAARRGAAARGAARRSSSRALRPVIAAALPIAQAAAGRAQRPHPAARPPAGAGARGRQLLHARRRRDLGLRRQRQPGPRLGAADPASAPHERDRRLQRRGRLGRPALRPHPGAAEGEPWKHYWRTFIGGGKPPRSYLDDSERSRERPDGAPGRGRSRPCSWSRRCWRSGSPRTRPATASTVQAEFDDVYPLLPGMHVRVDGAIAGSVDTIEITDQGTALVTLEPLGGHRRRRAPTPPPRSASRTSPATATSRSSPASAAEPLGDSVIANQRTLVAPRFDDLLNSFDEPVRQGLKLILIELGRGLERRGDDLNRADPRAAARARGGRTRRWPRCARRTPPCAAWSPTPRRSPARPPSARASSAGWSTRSSATLRTTAEHGRALDAALERLPETAGRTRETLGEARRASPSDVAAAGPDARRRRTRPRGDRFRRLGPFLDDARATMDAVGPTLTLVDNLLVKSLPTLRAAPIAGADRAARHRRRRRRRAQLAARRARAAEGSVLGRRLRPRAEGRRRRRPRRGRGRGRRPGRLRGQRSRRAASCAPRRC